MSYRNDTRKTLDAQQIKAASSGREIEILQAVAGIPSESLDGKHHACPKCGGHDRFRHMVERQAGVVHCNQCFNEGNGDFIAAVMWMRDCTFPEALQMIGDYLGVSPTTRPQEKQSTKAGKSGFDWKNIIAEYEYSDENCRMIYKVMRDSNKNFMQGRPNPDIPGKYLWNLKGVDRVPYQLPKLVHKNFSKGLKTIFIVEGEKDADNLNRLLLQSQTAGIVATTSGSSQSFDLWPGFIEKYHLAEKRVVVMPDVDEPGDLFGREVCRAFVSAGCEQIKLLTLPFPFGDVSDLIEERQNEGKKPGEIWQELHELCKQAERVTPETISGWPDRKTAIDTSKDKGNHRAVIKPFSEIEERETDWLWYNKIPAGELCLLSGMAGQGKTFWTCYLASIISNGWNWPDGTSCPLGTVLFFRGEDSIEKTVKPRLRANEADMNRVMLLDGLADDTVLTLLHVDAIRDAMRQSQERNGLPVRLIIIDPMADYMGDTKENSNCEVRNVLKGLKAIAEETGASFLLIQHTGKADRENMQQRVLGSTGIVASCRASFCLFTDKDTGHRIFAPMKNNLAVDPTSVVFTIDKTVRGGQVQIIDWELRKNADDIAAEMREAAFQNRTGRKPKESSEAEYWLREFLSGGRKPSGNPSDPQPGTVRYESDQAGHAWRTIERAKTSLGVKHFKDCGVTFWSLPPDLSILTEQLRQNSFSASDGTESQGIESDGETQALRQNATMHGNSGGVEQVSPFEPNDLNNVLNSNNQETDEKNTNSVFCSEAVPLPRKPPKKKPAQQLLVMTPSCRKEEPKHEQASLFD